MKRLLGLILVMRLRCSDLRGKQRGSTATEYAILVGFLALLIVLGVLFFGGQLNSWFNRLGDNVSSAASH